MLNIPFILTAPGKYDFKAKFATEKKETLPGKKNSYIPKNNELGMYRVLNNDINFKNNKKEDLDPDVFFIRMAWYKKDKNWAEKMKALTLETSQLMNSNEDFETIIKNIENSIFKINDNMLFGYRRHERISAYTIFENGRGEEYFAQYIERLYKNRLESLKIQGEGKYKHANTAEITASQNKIHISYRRDNKAPGNLELAQKTYEELKRIKNPSLDTVLEKTATIRWLIAQENPYYRGNESVATVLERAIFHSFGIENVRYKKQVSPDFEAFYRKLNEFIEVYPKLFEKKPEFTKV